MPNTRELGRLTRRSVLTGVAASGAAGFLPAPALGQGTALRVGALLPLTGGLDLQARQMRLGLDAAADAINGAGGVLGRPVEVVYADAKGTPMGLAETCNRLVRDDGIHAAVGPFISAGRKAATRALESLGVPLVSASNNEGLYCSDAYFSVGPTPSQDILALIRHLDAGEGRSYFMVGSYSSWQVSSFRQAILQAIYSLDGSVTGQALTQIEETNFEPVIRWAADTGATSVVFCVPRLQGVHFVRQAQALGLLEQIKFGWVGFNELHAAELPPAEANQVATVTSFVASDENGGVPDLVARMQGLGADDTPITYLAYTHYNALTAIAAAAQRVGELQASSIVQGLKGLTFESATGPVTIDAESGHAHFEIMAARGGAAGLDVVSRLGIVAPNSGCSVT